MKTAMITAPASAVSAIQLEALGSSRVSRQLAFFDTTAEIESPKGGAARGLHVAHTNRVDEIDLFPCALPNLPVPMTESAKPDGWPAPDRVLLLTYSRADHLATTLERGVAGVRADGAGSVAKARRVRPGDWVLIRSSDMPGFRAASPARITGKPIDQKPGSPYPDLLWQEEVEQSRVLFPLRIPVTFEDGPRTRPGCISWESLAELRLRGKDGHLIETPQQWGKKFAGNVLDSPAEVARMVELIRRCAG